MGGHYVQSTSKLIFCKWVPSTSHPPDINLLHVKRNKSASVLDFMSFIHVTIQSRHVFIISTPKVTFYNQNSRSIDHRSVNEN